MLIVIKMIPRWDERRLTYKVISYQLSFGKLLLLEGLKKFDCTENTLNCLQYNLYRRPKLYNKIDFILHIHKMLLPVFYLQNIESVLRKLNLY